MNAKPDYLYATYIRASADAVWEALTTPSFTSRYFHATHVESSWRVGDPVAYRYGNGEAAVEGEVLEAQPPHRLSVSWHVLYDDAARAEPPSTVTFLLETFGEQTKLTVEHTRFPEGSVVYDGISQGWPWILSSLKSLLETGEALPLARAS